MEGLLCDPVCDIGNIFVAWFVLFSIVVVEGCSVLSHPLSLSLKSCLGAEGRNGRSANFKDTRCCYSPVGRKCSVFLYIWDIDWFVLPGLFRIRARTMNCSTFRYAAGHRFLVRFVRDTRSDPVCHLGVFPKFFCFVQTNRFLVGECSVRFFT